MLDEAQHLIEVMASDSAREVLLQITESVRRYVESLQEGGVTGLPRATALSHGETGKRGNRETEAGRGDAGTRRCGE